MIQVRIQKKILLSFILCFIAGAAFAGEAARIEAGRMRSGIHGGRKAREFSGSVTLTGKDYVLYCDTLFLYEDGYWEAAGSIVINIPGMRIDAQTGRYSSDGLAAFSGCAYIFSIPLQIGFSRLSFSDPSRPVLEDAAFILDGWEDERSFSVLAIIFGERLLQLELPKDRISLAKTTVDEEAGRALFAAMQKKISDYIQGLRGANGGDQE